MGATTDGVGDHVPASVGCSEGLKPVGTTKSLCTGMAKKGRVFCPWPIEDTVAPRVTTS